MRTTGKPWEKHEKKHWNTSKKTTGQPWEKQRKAIGKPQEHNRQTTGKPFVKHMKIIEEPVIQPASTAPEGPRQEQEQARARQCFF